MQQLPLVSIIIPTYNNGPVICEAIECSLNQTYENREVIVVDDGSTDDTKHRLKNKYDSKIIYVRQGNKGTGGARNTGIRNASGKYLQFLDADDLLDPEKIRIQVKQLHDIPGKALSYCDYECRDMNDMTITYERISPVLQNEKPFDDIMMKWETELTIPIHSFLFDAALFKDSGIAFNERLRANEDWECLMDVFALDPKVVFIDRVLAYYRVRRDSRCRNKVVMRQSYLTAINKQIHKNWANKEVINKLIRRKKEIRYHYRDVSPIMRILELFPPAVKKYYLENVRWGIQRLFD